jgi:hypothetical protein
MAQVYIVTSGEYSDYSIDAVFSTPELAKEYTDRFGGEIETWDVDAPEWPPPGASVYCVTMGQDGSGRCSELETRDFRAGYYQVDMRIRWSPDHWALKEGKRQKFELLVVAGDKKAAVKIANEHRAWMIAMNVWGSRETGWMNHLAHDKFCEFPGPIGKPEPKARRVRRKEWEPEGRVFVECETCKAVLPPAWERPVCDSCLFKAPNVK